MREHERTARRAFTLTEPEPRGGLPPCWPAEIEARLSGPADAARLSITGTIWRGRRAESCWDSGGQVAERLAELAKRCGGAPGWLPEVLALWERWHLNDMRAGCEHQRAAWDLLEPLEVVSYGLTLEAHQERTRTIEAAARASAEGRPWTWTPRSRALVALERWYAEEHQPPDADSPLSGCYEVKKRETRPACHVTEKEHPRGLLSKPCPACGYLYGSAWLFEPLPADVLARVLAIFPELKEGRPCATS